MHNHRILEPEIGTEHLARILMELSDDLDER